MQTKTLLGGLIAAIAAFLIGWLVFGILLMDFYMANMESYPGLMREAPELIYIFLGNLSWGVMLSYVFTLGNIHSPQRGAIVGAILFSLITLGFDLLFYGQARLFSLKLVAVDVIANIIIGLIVGALLGWWFSRGKSAS
jgi:hypothetical protein